MKDNIRNERSSLWGTTSVAALGTGVGIGIAANRGVFADAWKAGRNDLASSAASHIGSVAGFTTSRARQAQSAAIGEGFQSMLANYEATAHPGALMSDIRQAGFEAILSGNKTSHRQAIEALSGVGKQTSAFGAFQATMSAVQKAGGSSSLLQAKIRGLGDQFKYTKPYLSEAVVSKGGVGGLMASYTTSPPAQFQTEAQKIRESFIKANPAAANIQWKFKTIKESISGKAVSTPMMYGELAGTQLQVPLANTGFTYGGESLTARYATRGAFVPGGQQLSYSELYTETMARSLNGTKNHREMKEAMHAAHKNIIQQMNSRDSAHRAAAVWSLPPNIMTSGGRAKSRLINQELVASGVPIEQIEGMLGQGIYPYTSPSAAGAGTVSRLNLAEELYGPLGKWISPEQRPGQFVRSEWGVTAAAKQSAPGFKNTFGKYYNRLDRKIKGSGYDKLIYGGASPLSAEAYSAPQLVSFYAKPQTKGYDAGYKAIGLNKFLSAEEGVISSSATSMMEYERIVQKNITVGEGLRVNKDIYSALEGQKVGGGFIPFKDEVGRGSSFLGIDAKTGKELYTTTENGLKTSIVGAELTGENMANVFIKERRTLSQDELWKLFSEDIKFMAGSKDKRAFEEILQAAQAGNFVGLTGQQVEAIFSGALVQRNKAALYNQQAEAISMLLSHRIDTGKIAMNREAEKFLQNPINSIGGGKLIDRGNEYAFQKRLIQKARRFGFGEQEMAITFGLMDEGIMESMVAKGHLSRNESLAIKGSTGVFGLFKGRLGDRAVEGGSGRRGSFEQSGFRLLASKGIEGERYAAELAQRIEGKGQLGAVDKMMASMFGTDQRSIIERIKTGGRLENIADLTPDTLVQAQGRQVSLGKSFSELKGASSIYIPGMDEAADLLTPTVSKGEVIQSPLVKQLQNVSSAARRNVPAEEMSAAVVSLRNTTARIAADQSAARGKIIGSKLLTATRSMAPGTSSSFAVSENMARQMYSDLIESSTGAGQKDILQSQLDDLLSGGRANVGMWRHPTSGPESFQFVRMRIDKRMADGMVQAPKHFGKLQFAHMNESIPVDLSEMVGIKGDFDKDQIVLSAISDRDTLNRVQKRAAHGSREAYTQYAFNHYALKDIIGQKQVKENITQLSQQEILLSGFQKLHTAKTKTGPINIALQKLKIGLQHTSPEEFNAMGELFFQLEESAISGKKGIQSSALYSGITQAVNQRDTSKLEGVFTSLLGGPQTRQGSITTAQGVTSSYSYSFDPKELAEKAMRGIKATSEDVDVAVKAASFAKGRNRADPALNDLMEMYYARKAGSIDVAQSLMEGAAGGGQTFTSKTSRLLRSAQTRSSAMFGALNKAKAPMLMGAAAAAGIMLAAPSISGSVRPSESASAGRSVTSDNYGPPSGMGMNPPAPGPLTSPKVYDIGSGHRTLSRANIRMRLNDMDSSSNDFMKSAQKLSMNGNVNIRTRDDRSILDPQMLASKIHERL